VTGLVCARCGEPIKPGERHGYTPGVGYVHMVFINGGWVTSCPQPDPVAESDEEEPAIDGLASPQVNSTAPPLSTSDSQTIDRGSVQSFEGAASGVGAAPTSVCLNCNMEVATWIDDCPVPLDRCPICGSWLCTCPGDSEDGHQPECPFWRGLATSPPEELR
jgi:hypothetical protein